MASRNASGSICSPVEFSRALKMRDLVSQVGAAEGELVPPDQVPGEVGEEVGLRRHGHSGDLAGQPLDEGRSGPRGPDYQEADVLSRH